MITRIGPGQRLSKAVVANGFVFLSGLTANVKSSDVGTQTEDILRQIDDLLISAGSSRSKLVLANIWLEDINDFSAMNTIWERWIDIANPPARATVQAKLAGRGSLVEIMAKALA